MPSKIVRVTIDDFDYDNEGSYSDDDTFVMTVKEYRGIMFASEVHHDAMKKCCSELSSLKKMMNAWDTWARNNPKELMK